MSGWIGVDFDGTLVMYNGWKGPLHIGEPVQIMVERVKWWIKEGRRVKIFTARVSFPPMPTDGNLKSLEYLDWAERKFNADLAREAIKLWCKRHLDVVLEITNEKDFGMIELWDDRCIQVEMNTGHALGVSKIL